jgi:glycosyltransferase involved in cell wall biosynthesis
MKIALFTDTYLPQINGVTNTIDRLEKYFTKKNIDYKILAPEYEEMWRNEKVESFYSFKFLLYPECRLSIFTNGRVNSILSNFKPDLVHLATEFNMGWAGVNYALRNDLPCISTYTTNYSEYLKYYKFDLLSNVAWDYFKWFHNQNDLTLCPSTETKGLLLQKGINNVDVWGRGIDSSHFSPSKRNSSIRTKYKIKDEEILLLYVGRISVEKDLDILFDAYREIQNAHNNIKLIVAGEGPLMGKFKTENPGVIFTGYMKGEALAELYASSDIMTFPSSTETLGNVVLEAMASGIPVVGVNSGGVKENIIDGWNGIMCKPRNTASYYEGIKRFIENREYRLLLGENARHFALSKDWDQVFEKLVRDYSEMISSKKQIAA